MMKKDKPAAECLRYCVKQEPSTRLSGDKKVYTLEGHEAELDQITPRKSHCEGNVERRNLDGGIRNSGEVT